MPSGEIKGLNEVKRRRKRLGRVDSKPKDSNQCICTLFATFAPLYYFIQKNTFISGFYDQLTTIFQLHFEMLK